MCRSDMMWIARHSCSSEHEVKGSAFQPASRNRGRSSSWISRPILSHLVAMATFHLDAVARLPPHVWHTNSVQSCIAAISKEQQTDYLVGQHKVISNLLLYPPFTPNYPWETTETTGLYPVRWIFGTRTDCQSHLAIPSWQTSIPWHHRKWELPSSSQVFFEDIPSKTGRCFLGQVVYSPLLHMDEIHKVEFPSS